MTRYNLNSFSGRTGFSHQTRIAPVLAIFSVFVLGFDLSYANSGPQLLPIFDQFVSEGQTVRLLVKATDSDGDALALGMIQRPSGSDFIDNGDGTGEFIWTVDYIGAVSSAGSPFVAEFVVSDGLSQMAQSVTLFVQNVNRYPVITSIDTAYVEAGDSLDFQFSVFDPDFETITWQALSLPSGSSLNPVPGAPELVSFNWRTSLADSGAATVAIIATDESGLADTALATAFVTAGVTYALNVKQDTVYPGETVALTVNIKNRDSLGSFEIALSYDPSVMVVLSITNSGTRTENFEKFSFLNNTPLLGDLRLIGVANLPEAPETPALEPGDGALCTILFRVSSQLGLSGLFLPVRFGTADPFEDFTVTLTDGAGIEIDSNSYSLTDGGLKIKDQVDILIGDINLNGVAYEISDALRFSNYFLDPVKYFFNAQQFANSDVNGDGIAASVADLVTLLTIISSGGGSGAPRIDDSGEPKTATVYLREKNTSVGNVVEVVVEIVVEIAAELPLEFGGAHVRVLAPTVTSGINSGQLQIALSEELEDLGFELLSETRGDTLLATIYSVNGAGVNPGSVSLLTIETGAFESVALLSVDLSSIDGETILSSIASDVTIVLPESFELRQNYPNPFNPSSTIPFSLKETMKIKLEVFDILGRSVRTLIEEIYDSGEHIAVWDGSDNAGAQVASGIYIYRLTAKDHALSRKMALVK